MKIYVYGFGLLLLSLVLSAPAAKPPNVVLIFADDLGYGDLGCYGATKVQTPHIDSLARDGRKFTDAHSASAVCTPSRYALLTGEYPLRAMGGKGVWGPLSPISGLIVDTETPTIGKVLKRKGYATACIGKWHLGFGEGQNLWNKMPVRPGPGEVGFDYYFGLPLVNSGSPFVYVENDRVVGWDPADPLVYGSKNPSSTPTFPPEASRKGPNRFGGALKAHKLYDDEKFGTLFTEKAVNWIGEITRSTSSRQADKPFFLYFATPHIHHPFTPAPRFKGTSQCGLYGDFIHELDWMVGELLACLDEHGLSDSTLVIFTSDNGGMLNLAGRNAMKAGHRINGDLLGFKFGAWEGGHRVPFIARWPGRIKPGTESDQVICHVDMLATFMALTGQEPASLEHKDSVNVLPALLKDPEDPIRKELVLAPKSSRHLSLRQGKWMYIGARGSGGFSGSKPNQHAWGGPPAAQFAGSENSDIENGRIKKDAPAAQLYDLEADPRQTRNVIRSHPEVAARLQARLRPYLQREAAKSGPAPLHNKPAGNLRFTFEDGSAEGWRKVEGDVTQFVTGLKPFYKRGDEGREGRFLLNTLSRTKPGNGGDPYTAVLESPAFRLEGDQLSLLMGGGNHRDTFLALVDAVSGNVLKKESGPGGPEMRRRVWDVSAWRERSVRLRVVDLRVSKGGWSHLTLDDVSVQGTLLPKLEEPSQPKTDSPSSAPEPDVSARPNVLLIYVDDMGYNDLGCYAARDPGIKTPNIDRLASEGVRFSNYLSACSVCSPSRAAVLTGRYPQRNGMPVCSNDKPEHRDWYETVGLPPSEITIAELLKPLGYATAAYGKWHLGDADKFAPRKQGFDEYIGRKHNFHVGKPGVWFRNEEPQGEIMFREAHQILTDATIAFMKKQREGENPFFIYLAHYLVHGPWSPNEAFCTPEEWASVQKHKGGMNSLALPAMARELDHHVGLVLATLKELDIEDETLVILASDNGPWLPAGSAHPLSGAKYTTMEGGHRVPAMMRWPGRIPAGQVSDQLVSALDVLPTIAAVTGASLLDDRTYDGYDLMPMLSGKTDKSPRREFAYYNGLTLEAVRREPWKLHLPRKAAHRVYWARHPKKMYLNLDHAVLNNLTDDMAEKNNLAGSHTEQTQALQKRAEEIRHELGDWNKEGTDRPVFTYPGDLNNPNWKKKRKR